MLVTTEPANTTNAARKHIAHDPLGNTLGPVMLVTIWKQELYRFQQWWILVATSILGVV